eukprot:TRINITY_DN16293_c0_g1_i1.p1 TRINITY_DN16293_c0_g1~~TRINITY_DN16293_c0_g1_i1.p1  ORF type:complete len:107 (-),score=11.06 TRINITY_DN16293_c0_g1_i1:70-390(-)
MESLCTAQHFGKHIIFFFSYVVVEDVLWRVEYTLLPSTKPMSSEFVRAALKVVAAQACEKAGFHKIESSALETMTDLIQQCRFPHFAIVSSLSTFFFFFLKFNLLV